MSETKPASGMTTGAKVKLGLVILTAGLLLIFVLSNGDSVPVKFFTSELMIVPAWLLITLAGAGGFAIGWTVCSSRARQKAKKALAKT